MNPTHKCDYCGSRHFFEEEKHCCSICGQFRMVCLATQKPTRLYQRPEGDFYSPQKAAKKEHNPPKATSVWEEPKVDEEEPEPEPTRQKKVSKDNKAKRTSHPIFAANRRNQNKRI